MRHGEFEAMFTHIIRVAVQLLNGCLQMKKQQTNLAEQRMPMPSTAELDTCGYLFPSLPKDYFDVDGPLKQGKILYEQMDGNTMDNAQVTFVLPPELPCLQPSNFACTFWATCCFLCCGRVGSQLCCFHRWLG